MARRALIIGLLVAPTLAAASGTRADGARDPYEAMAVRRVSAPELPPDVSFTTLDGRPARLEDFGGQVVLLGFFTTW